MSTVSPSLQTTCTTPYHCNCLLPVAAAPDTVLYGMYEHVSDSERFGGIKAVRMAKEGDEVTASTIDVGYVDGAECSEIPGVFDMCYSGRTEGELFVSQTDGALRVAQVAVDETKIASIKTKSVFQLNDNMLTSSTALCGAAAWASSPGAVVSSAHKGSLILADLERPAEAAIISTWAGHEYDAWCTAVQTSTGLVWSGGDDGYLRAWDLRGKFTNAADDDDELMAVKGKRHDAGVVTIVPVGEHQVLAGSYDEHLHLYDSRQMKRAVSSVHVGGGVWRVRELPRANSEDSMRFIVAAMQCGASVVELSGDELSLCELSGSDDTTFHGDTENPLIYDVLANVQAGDVSLAATVSFYENTIKFWSL